MSKKNKIKETEEIKDVIETVETTPETEVTISEEAEVKPVVGQVTCNILNVRKKPTIGADILNTLVKGTEVTINEEKSNDAWFAVTTKDGINGFCMKKFITIK